MSSFLPRAAAAAAAAAVFFFAPPCHADAPLIQDYDGYNAGAYGPRPNQTFLSTDIAAPLFQINSWNTTATDTSPYLFLGLWNPLGGSAGPLIFSTEDFSLVYADWRYPSTHNTQIQKVGGIPYLTYYEGNQKDGHSMGNCLFLDHTYRLKYTINTKNVSSTVDMHECQVTEDDTVLISVYETMPMDLSTVDGPADGELLDSIVQEIDIKTGELRWMWKASDHMSIYDSYQHWRDTEGGWDFFHLNAVQKTHDGNYLISARHFHTLTYINGSTHETIWTLGGKQNDFADLSGGNATNFGWQHHARFANENLTQVTMFDNHGLKSEYGCTEDCSRGLHLELDFENMTAKVLEEHFHPESLRSEARGGYTHLSNGNALIQWGVNPAFTEYSPDGECVQDVQFDLWDPSAQGRGGYRAFKDHWVGMPYWDPDIAAVPEWYGGYKVALSWNGATEIKSWKLFTGDTPSTVRTKSHDIVKNGFETTMIVPKGPRFARGVAYDRRGRVLGKTAVVDLVTGEITPVIEIPADVTVQDFLGGLYTYIIRMMSFFR